MCQRSTDTTKQYVGDNKSTDTTQSMFSIGCRAVSSLRMSPQTNARSLPSFGPETIVFFFCFLLSTKQQAQQGLKITRTYPTQINTTTKCINLPYIPPPDPRRRQRTHKNKHKTYKSVPGYRQQTANIPLRHENPAAAKQRKHIERVSVGIPPVLSVCVRPLDWLCVQRSEARAPAKVLDT